MTTVEQTPRASFDADYYARYYKNPATRVADRGYYTSVARFLSAYCKLLDIDVATILDVGAGVGRFRKPLLKSFPGAHYHGIEISQYACERYGWEVGCASTFTTRRRFDLILCHDVLQYLDKNTAAAAIENLDRLCRSALYFSVLTAEDWQSSCDQSRTDSAVHLRRATWYRRRLKPHFRNAGGGLYISRRAKFVLYALEHLD